jgi:predicted RNase H-like nuclease
VPPVKGGPELPYKVVAAVTPAPGGWLVCAAKLHAATFAPEEPRIIESFSLVFEERPPFEVIALNAPIGYPDEPGHPRACDLEARRLLGSRRGLTIGTTPIRSSVETGLPREDERLDAITLMMLPRYGEVIAEMLPFRQRTVYEARPELSFLVINGDQPLTWPKRREEGIEERRALLEKRIPGIRRVLDAEVPPRIKPWHLNDAGAMLWTARRIFAKAGTRIPTDPEWDSEGLRQEIVR